MNDPALKTLGITPTIDSLYRTVHSPWLGAIAPETVYFDFSLE